MLLLGIDLGTSSVKVSVVDSNTQGLVAAASYPETEAEIIALQPGWAEQRPEQWWTFVKMAILKCHATGKYQSMDIGAIGIAYQMHGLVLTDKNQEVLRNAIIWCDSRAVEIGNQAFEAIGEAKCLSRLLNSPGNFTASKLAWVKQSEPAVYSQVDKLMLPGDFISMKMTGEVNTTISALSEGIFWDFQSNTISADVLEYFQFSKELFPTIHPVFSSHGRLQAQVASELNLKPGTIIAYKAGDQPNNALALNVLEPGEVAATAGTSGVVYGVSDQLGADMASRINTFAHVNYEPGHIRTGVLLCINGTGIFNKWIKNSLGANHSYAHLNELASQVDIGSRGLMALPFGNGAERIFQNKLVGAHFLGLDLNIHTSAHLVRAVQEGIAFSMRYGLDIMRENGMNPKIVRAGRSNLFLSDVFSHAFANVNDVIVEFFEGDGSYGAAIGAGIGIGEYKSTQEACLLRKSIGRVEPHQHVLFDELYQKWKRVLVNQLSLLS